MVRRFAVVAVVAGSLASSWAASAGPGGAAQIGPDQRFVGLVNANHSGAFLYVVCPGPAQPGQTGAPVGGQTVAAISLPTGALSGGGYTGDTATSLVVDLAGAGSVTLHRYGIAKLVPKTLRFPCSGTDSFTFTASPTSGNSISDKVQVTFENIAA